MHRNWDPFFAVYKLVSDYASSWLKFEQEKAFRYLLHLVASCRLGEKMILEVRLIPYRVKGRKRSSLRILMAIDLGGYGARIGVMEGNVVWTRANSLATLMKRHWEILGRNIVGFASPPLERTPD